MVPEAPPKGESQANAYVEESVKTVRGFSKVLKSQLEEGTGLTISGQDAITQWMIRWSVMLPSRFLVEDVGFKT